MSVPHYFLVTNPGKTPTIQDLASAGVTVRPCPALELPTPIQPSKILSGVFLQSSTMPRETVFQYWSSPAEPDNRKAIFLERAQPSLDRKWSWCPNAFTRKYSAEKTCDVCNQPIKPISQGLIRPHLTRKTHPGIYLIDVGRHKKASGPRYLKIGMSQRPMEGRLNDHLQNPKHQRCIIHYCFSVEPTDSLTWQVPFILESLLQGHLVKTGKTAYAYEYFPWSDELIQQCIDYLERPGLVESIRRLMG